MIRRLIFLSLFALLLAVACLGPLPPHMGSDPIMRIGLMQNVAEVRFQTPEKLSLRHPNGRLIAAEVTGKRWRMGIKQIEPARLEYRLLVISTKDKAEAKAVLNQVIDAGLLADMIEERPDYDRIWVAQNATNIYKVMLREKFPTAEAALARQKETAAKIQSELWEAVKRPASGALELKNLDNNKSYQLPSSVQVLADRMEISQVAVGAGFHWENSENRVYSHRLEFFIDRSSKMTVVNILPIENYVAGVVSAEMSPGFPLEALKRRRWRRATRLFQNRHAASRRWFRSVCGRALPGLWRRQPATGEHRSGGEGDLRFGDEIEWRRYRGKLCRSLRRPYGKQ
jgi:hypothetical protein